MNKIISFIIPSYNVEKYLRKALNSFLLQEQQDLQEKIEVIIVDDGSSDGTAEIAQEYVKRMPEVFRLLQKENGGHGSAINEGSRIAVGKYLKVIDADDWVVTENLPELIKKLEVCEADVVLNPFHMVDMNTKERTIQKMYINDYDRSYTPSELAADWKAFDKCTTFHGITYRTEFYNLHRHELSEKIFYEDQEYATIPACLAEKIAVLDLYLYQYQIGNSEQSVAKYNQLKRIAHLETVIEHMLLYWKKNNTLQNFHNAYYLRKTEGIVLNYYANMCVVNPNKHEGRRRCKLLNKKIKAEYPALMAILKKSYILYVIFSILGISEQDYEKVIHSRVFQIIRHNHKIIKEKND